MLQGIDVSHYQGKVDWKRVITAGAAFAFVKATQGVKYVDSEFKNNWKGLSATNFPRGAYHFFNPGDKGLDQAEHFLEVFVNEYGSLPPVLDVESSGDWDIPTLTKEVQDWLETVEKKTARKPILYTCASFWNSHINVAAQTPNTNQDENIQPSVNANTGAFSQYPLWVAHYGAKTPKIPTGWQNWTFWQYSQTGKIDGVSGAVDLNWFNGETAALLEWLKK